MADRKDAPHIEKGTDVIQSDEGEDVALAVGTNEEEMDVDEENTVSAEKLPCATTPIKEKSVSFKASPAVVQPMKQTEQTANGARARRKQLIAPDKYVCDVLPAGTCQELPTFRRAGIDWPSRCATHKEADMLSVTDESSKAVGKDIKKSKKKGPRKGSF